jgi:hypothetical protein
LLIHYLIVLFAKLYALSPRSVLLFLLFGGSSTSAMIKESSFAVAPFHRVANKTVQSSIISSSYFHAMKIAREQVEVDLYVYSTIQMRTK